MISLRSNDNFLGYVKECEFKSVKVKVCIAFLLLARKNASALIYLTKYAIDTKNCLLAWCLVFSNYAW